MPKLYGIYLVIGSHTRQSNNLDLGREYRELLFVRRAERDGEACGKVSKIDVWTTQWGAQLLLRRRDAHGAS
jgi:hypothetical protein